MPADNEVLEQRWGPVDTDAYRIDSLGAADFAARKIRQIQERAAEEAAKYDEAIREWTEAKAAALRKITHEAELYEFNLRLFLQHEVENQGEDADPTKAYGIKLPCGAELNYRPNPTGQPSLKVDDEAALLEWAMEHAPDAVTMGVDRALVKKAALASGELPAGAHLEPPKHEPWQVKV